MKVKSGILFFVCYFLCIKCNNEYPLNAVLTQTYTIEWTIIDKELERIKVKEYQYGPYIHVRSVPFYLKLYPKRELNADAFEIYLYCDASQHDISQIKLEQTQSIKEISYKESNINIYNKFPDRGRIIKSPKWDELKDLNEISISVSFRIIDMWDNNNNIIPKIYWNKHLNPLTIIQTLKWSLNNHDMNQLKLLNFTQKMVSNYSYINQIPLRIGLYPKGFDSENNVEIFLECEAQGLDVSEIYIWYNMNIDILGFRFIFSNKYKDFPTGWGIPDNVIASNDILNLKHLKIDITFQILSLKDNDGNIIHHNDWNNDNKLFELKNDIDLLKIDNEARNLMIVQNQEIINELETHSESQNQLNLKNQEMMNDLKKEIISLKIKNDQDIKALKKYNKQNRYELIISFKSFNSSHFGDLIILPLSGNLL